MSASNWSSSEKRNTSGPGGSSSGEVAPASATASRNRPSRRERSGKSQAVSAILPTRHEHSHEPGQRLVGPPQVHDQKVADHGVERAVVEGELVHVRLAELDARMQPLGKRDHRRRDIHPHHRRAALCRPRRHVARARGDVEHSSPPCHVRRIEERLGEAARDVPNQAVVATRLVLPSRGLEGVERVRVDARLAHDRTISAATVNPVVNDSFKALSHPIRRGIVERLAEGPATVGEATAGLRRLEARDHEAPEGARGDGGRHARGRRPHAPPLAPARRAERGGRLDGSPTRPLGPHVRRSR